MGKMKSSDRKKYFGELYRDLLFISIWAVISWLGAYVAHFYIPVFERWERNGLHPAVIVLSFVFISLVLTIIVYRILKRSFKL